MLLALVFNSNFRTFVQIFPFGKSQLKITPLFFILIFLNNDFKVGYPDKNDEFRPLPLKLFIYIYRRSFLG